MLWYDGKCHDDVHVLLCSCSIYTPIEAGFGVDTAMDSEINDFVSFVKA